MGLSVASVQLRGTSVATALQLAADAFGAEGWRLVDHPGPRTGELGAASAGGWVSLLLPRRWSQNVVDRIAQASGLPGIHLYVFDSDFWGGALFHEGAVVRRFDTRKRPPGARALRRQIAKTLGIDVPERRLAEVLASNPTYAEESLDAFARLLSLENVLDLPADGATTVLVERPASGLEAQLAGMLDMRAHALILAPAPGFGAAAMALLRLLAERLGGGHLGPRNVIVEGGRIGKFSEDELPAIAARLDAGELDSVDADFDGVSFNCRRHGTDGRQLQIVAPGLLTVEGRLTRADALGLLDPSAALLEHLFVATQATVGLVDPVSSDVAQAAADLRSLVTWPPVAHWVTYLPPELARALGDAAAKRAAAEGWQISQT